MRARVRWTSGWSRIAQLSAGERHEDVLQRGMVGSEERELGATPLEQPEQRGHGAMYLRHRERRAIDSGAHGAHARQRGQLRRARRPGCPVRQGELHDMLGTEEAIRERGVPSAITFPWSMMATRSHRR